MTYIVCYIEEDLNDIDNVTETDQYQVFESLNMASKFYKDLIDKEYIHSVSLCKVIKSTDYDTL